LDACLLRVGDAIGLVALSGFPCPFFETDGRVVLVSSCRRELQPARERERERGGGDREERENLYGFVFSDWWPWCSGSERGRPLVWVWGVQLQPQPLPRAEALSLPGLTKTHHRRRALVSIYAHPPNPTLDGLLPLPFSLSSFEPHRSSARSCHLLLAPSHLKTMCRTFILFLPG
jgi:hypothetical protein